MTRGVPRLLHDRYVVYDEVRACDLATGQEVRLDDLPRDSAAPAAASLIELFDDARDGWPRSVILDARSSAHARSLARSAAAAGWHRGFVPILVPLYESFLDVLTADLADRTLLLLTPAECRKGAGPMALVHAAARSRRPHLLLAFRIALGMPAACRVREARAEYAAARTVRPDVPAWSSDIARHIERGARAEEFRRSGRHAAAERLLRDVSAALARRDAWSPASDASVRLGRLLLDRGRPAAADAVFGDAASLAERAADDTRALGARLWQATARVDARRLTDAESLCRAVLLTGRLGDAQQVWAHSILIRIFCEQGRVDEALLTPAPAAEWTDRAMDDAVIASIHFAYTGLFLVAGRVFEAGQRARALIRATSAADVRARAISATAHLWVLAASGDLHLAGEQWRRVCELSRQARAPLIRVRATLIWLDALARAGRVREAEGLLHAQARMVRAASPHLRSAVDERRSWLAGAPGARGGAAETQTPGSAAATLVHLVHAEEDDLAAVRVLIARLVRDLLASRAEVVSSDAGPVSVVAGAGAGLPTEIGARILEAGIPITSSREGGGCEAGVPMRYSSRLVGALVCRWPVDRQPPPHALDALALGAAIAAPRVDGFLSRARETAAASAAVPELIGVSAAIAEVRRGIERAARAPFAVLIEGESGVGKELAARAIHQLSARRERRFCDVNCAALPDELLESELFGHARGAFTGALSDKAGLVEEADGGTLFLDEVADLSPRAQAKLLRVIQQQEIRRVGETFARTVDVRFVTAANRDMRREAAERRFRADLLYRLDVIHLRIPPLRERPEDISVLARHFWRLAAERVGSVATLTPEVIAALARHTWPGNVRELQNILSALAVAAPPRGRIRSALLPPVIAAAAVPAVMTLCQARVEFERRFIEAALARAGGSRTRAAQALGISRQGLLKTMARLHIGVRTKVEACNEAPRA